MHTSHRGAFNAIIKTMDEPMFTVAGILLQFVSTPHQNGGDLSVMRAGLPPGAVIPLHSHSDAEIFYVLEGAMEIYQDDGTSSGWQTASRGEVVTIAGGVKHALRNPNSTLVRAIALCGRQLYCFFRELAEPLDPNAPPSMPTPEAMQKLFAVAARYEYWLGSPSENAAIGINLG